MKEQLNCDIIQSGKHWGGSVKTMKKGLGLEPEV